VRNRATGMDEEIIYDDTTTILGIIQACGKLVPSRVPFSGIRLFPNTYFFAVHNAKLSEYKIGTEITEVEYDDAGQDAIYLPPECVLSVRSKLERYIELRKEISTLTDKVIATVCKLTGALPPINTTTSPVLMKKAAAMGGSAQLTRPQTRMIKPGEIDFKALAKPGEKSCSGAAPSVWSSEARAEPFQQLASENLPAMELELQDTMKWISELVYLAVWWDSLESSEREFSDTITEAKQHVNHLFGPLCTNKASRSELIQNGCLTPKQIVAIVNCLDFVAHH